jgi:hypothetical protein
MNKWIVGGIAAAVAAVGVGAYVLYKVVRKDSHDDDDEEGGKREMYILK